MRKAAFSRLSSFRAATVARLKPSQLSETGNSVQMSNPTVPTRFLVISDTHNYEFKNSGWVDSPFCQPVPKCDVLLHCGDLTMVGGVPKYKRVLEMLKEIPAELKLVIAGNHDLDLDREWWRSHPERAENPAQHEEAVEVMNGPLAKEGGVTYLDEGIHSFTLQNGAKFTVYASPWQPEFYDWAFNYPRNQDRYNTPDQVARGVSSVAQNPIPDFGVVDVIMTHGPPKDILDWTSHGNAGCDNILRAISRARPRLHCFGHIHEGYGATQVAWKNDTKVLGPSAISNRIPLTNSYPEPNKHPVVFGKETLFINAAIMDVDYDPVNAPWLVDIDLPKA
jgi:hypothetical protein